MGIVQDYNVCFWLRFQPVDATLALNLLSGVSQPNDLPGRSFNQSTTTFRIA
jgi:hypothetical protein